MKGSDNEMDAIEAAYAGFDAVWKANMYPAEYSLESIERQAIDAAISAYLAVSGVGREDARDGGATVLPDGSAFSIVTLALPSDHWLYAPHCEQWDNERDTSADTPLPILANEHRNAVIVAMRWAIRGATMNGKEMDFDPDALALNAAYALCGPVANLAIDAAMRGEGVEA